MNWQKIDPNNLPKGEVLAINLAYPDFPEHQRLDYGQKAIGYLDYDLHIWCRDSFGEILIIDCTHYIEIDSIQMPKFDSDFEIDNNLTIDINPSNQSVQLVRQTEILAKVLEKIGMDHHEFAKIVGVHHKTIEGFILGEQPISGELGRKIEDALGMGDRLWLRLRQLPAEKKIKTLKEGQYWMALAEKYTFRDEHYRALCAYKMAVGYFFELKDKDSILQIFKERPAVKGLLSSEILDFCDC
jgi:plasmid maintenance system antidote protein VapI